MDSRSYMQETFEFSWSASSLQIHYYSFLEHQNSVADEMSLCSYVCCVASVKRRFSYEPAKYLLFWLIAVGALVQLINDGPNPLLFISGTSKLSCLNELMFVVWLPLRLFLSSVFLLWACEVFYYSERLQLVLWFNWLMIGCYLVEYCAFWDKLIILLTCR
jgi:hypothetical protein